MRLPTDQLEALHERSVAIGSGTYLPQFEENDTIGDNFTVESRIARTGCSEIYEGSIDGIAGVAKIWRVPDEERIYRIFRGVAIQEMLRKEDCEVPDILAKGVVLHNDHFYPYMVEDWMIGSVAKSLEPADDKIDPQIYINKIVDAFGPAVSTLDKMHDIGLVHRDVTPGNILLDLNGDGYLNDFDMVAVTGEAIEVDLHLATVSDSVLYAELTATNDLRGTPGYFDPKLVTGVEGDNAAQPANDVIGVCISLYKTITGVLPWPTRDARYPRADPAKIYLQNTSEYDIPEHPSEINQNIPRELGDIPMMGFPRCPRERAPMAGISDRLKALAS